MVGTLIKHEVRRTLPAIAAVYGVAAVSILTAGLLAASNIPVLSQMGMVIVVTLLGGTTFGLQVYLARDFWSTGFGQQGYLTHSLPLPGRVILRARLLWAAAVAAFASIWMAVMALVSIIFLTPAFMPGADGLAALRQALEVIAQHTEPWHLVVLFLLLWLGNAANQFNLYFAASLGSSPRLVGLGAAGPVLVWIVSGFVFQLLSLLSLLIPLAYTDTRAGHQVQVVNILAMIGRNTDTFFLPLGWVFTLIACVVVIVLWMRHVWDRQISLR